MDGLLPSDGLVDGPCYGTMCIGGLKLISPRTHNSQFLHLPENKEKTILFKIFVETMVLIKTKRS